MARPSTVLDTCLAELRRRAAKSSVNPSRRIPGLRQLCRELGLSQTTVLRALGILKREGLIETRPGRGIFATSSDRAVECYPDSPAIAANLLAPCKWQRVAAALRRDIIDGKLDATAFLPASKTLERQYGANFRTIRKALDSLYAEKHLFLEKGRYGVAGPSAFRAGSKVALIMRADLPRTFGSLGPRGAELFREIETHCLSRRIGIVHIICDYTGSNMHITPGIAATASEYAETLLGVIFWVAGFTPDQVALILAQLEPLGVPISVLDEQDIVRQLAFRPPRTTRIITMGTGRECGKEMGRYLIRNGHRRIAYLDFEPLVSWSARRLAGLRDAFIECGLLDTVECVTLGPAIPPELVRTPFSIDQLAPSARCRYPRDEIHRALRRIESIVWGALRDERRAAHLQATLGGLLRHTGITAWVASCDSLAIACLNQLALRRVKVPQKISVVGFDDIPESLYWSLTSYNFNLRAVAGRLIDIAVSSPTVLRREYVSSPDIVPGYITERTTCSASGLRHAQSA